jgi:putative ABC transport system substrate-binding protein
VKALPISQEPGVPDNQEAACVSVEALAGRRRLFDQDVNGRTGDPPVQQPTKFELVINRKTAKVLGVTFPKSILLPATKAIE